jgi:hypothetical protein
VSEAKASSTQSLDQLIPALVKATSEIGAVPKTGENKYDRYTYAKLEDFVRASNGPLCKNGLALTFDVLGVENLEARKTKQGAEENGVRVHLQGKLLHVSGQMLTAMGVGDGYDRGDKAAYKALTGARKYLIANMLNLATTDDPEEDSAPAPARNDAADLSRFKDEAREERRREERQPERQREPERTREEKRQEPAKPSPAEEARDEWDDMDEADLKKAADHMIQKIVVGERQLGTLVNGQAVTVRDVLRTCSKKDGKVMDRLDDFFKFELTDPSRHSSMMRWLKFTLRNLHAALEDLSEALVKAGKLASAPIEGNDDGLDEIPF